MPRIGLRTARALRTIAFLVALASAAEVAAFARGCVVPDVYPTGGDGSVAGAVADLDGVGGPDLIVLNATSSNLSVLLNQGDGTFAAPVLYDIPRVWFFNADVVAAELDGVNGPDVAYITDGSQLGVRYNLGGGVLGPETLLPYTNFDTKVWLRVGEVDGVSGLDLIAGGLAGFAVYRNDGAGGFLPAIDHPSVEPIQAAGAVDVDGDSILDLLGGNSNEFDLDELYLWRGAGDGSFAAADAVANGFNNLLWDLVIADFDGVNGPDVASYGGLFADVNVHFNDGAGQFDFNGVTGRHRVVAGPSDLAAGELDCKSGPELLIADRDADRVAVMLNRGGGVLELDSYVPAGVQPAAVLVAPLDAIAGPDWAVVNPDGNVSVSLNCYGLACLSETWLLRNDDVGSIAPLDVSLASIFALADGALIEDGHVRGFAPGRLDPDAAVLGDVTRPLVLYQVTDPVAVVRLTTSSGAVRVDF